LYFKQGKLLVFLGVTKMKKQKLPLWSKITIGFVIFILLGIWLRFQKNYANFELERDARNEISTIFDNQEEYYKLFTKPFKTDAKIEFAQQYTYKIGNSKEYYDYTIIRESPTAIIVTAKAKEKGLKSFTGVLFIKSGYFTRRLCETKELSQVSPPIIQATDIENGCPSDAELYTEGSFEPENRVTYEVNFIGNAGCYEYNAFRLPPGGDSRKGHFVDLIDKYGLLDNETFLLRVKELRAKRDYCNKNTAIRICNQKGECAKAGFNISLKSSEDPNNILDIAVVSYIPLPKGVAYPSDWNDMNWPDLYVFDPTNKGMEVRTSTTRGSGIGSKKLSLKELWEIFLR
jgi:uncharacterized protein (DUF983 family)